jgi:hypothetical protein
VKRALFLFWLAGSVQAITIGQGPAIGTDKRGTTWYQEFQDWTSNDVRAVSANDNEYKFNNQYDPSRDIIAFYSHDGGADSNYYFRVDFFDLLTGAENGNLDVYVLIDCAAGGASALPDSVVGTTDHPWEIAVKVYDSVNKGVATPTTNITGSAWVGSYWNASLDSVEFGIKRQALLRRLERHQSHLLPSIHHQRFQHHTSRHNQFV